ncbi:hypothetical protein BT96DRAFT_1000584 [Gymnopus androsaceus JB14]|uniref:Uncharacterized protein n=1 Tax=Gymnopus androsaceus JB14 TaxID=1447944 RepID=A0A6A4H1W7_9AGAR|nr:hypothetical protein BT96DRAFT_1000584 [Gymnopus androsaceus JB14]
MILKEVAITKNGHNRTTERNFATAGKTNFLPVDASKDTNMQIRFFMASSKAYAKIATGDIVVISMERKPKHPWIWAANDEFWNAELTVLWDSISIDKTLKIMHQEDIWKAVNGPMPEVAKPM